MRVNVNAGTGSRTGTGIAKQKMRRERKEGLPITTNDGSVLDNELNNTVQQEFTIPTKKRNRHERFITHTVPSARHARR